MLLLTFLSTICFASPLPSAQEDDPTVLVGPALLQGHIQWSEDLSEALAKRKYSTAVQVLQTMDTAAIAGPDTGDYAFVLAWSLLRARRGKEAIALLEKVEKSRTAPKDYRWLTFPTMDDARGWMMVEYPQLEDCELIDAKLQGHESVLAGLGV